MNCVMMKKYPVEILEELCFDGGVFTDNDDDNYSLELVYKVNNSDEHNFVDCFEVIPKIKTIVVFEEVE